MTAYAVFGVTSNWVTVKAGAVLPIKITRIDVDSGVATGVTIAMYTGDGTITGGSTTTPFPMRVGAPAAGATAKSGATAVSGTADNFVSQSLAAASAMSWSPSSSLMFAAGSSTVMTVQLTANGVVTIYFDEQRLQGGF